MTEIRNLTVKKRDGVGKGAARSARRAGMLPGVIYGDKKPPVPIAVVPKDLHTELSRGGFFAQLYDLAVEGETYRVLPRDLQLDPLTDRPVHIDFQRVGAATRIRVAVPIRVINEGQSPGLKLGGVLNLVRHELEVFCRADSIPPLIEVNLEGLSIGDSVHISAVKLPEGVQPVVSGEDLTLVTIVAPTTQAEAEEKPAAEAAAAAAAAATAAPAAGATAGGAAAPAGAPAKGATAPAKSAGAPAKGGGKGGG